MRENKQLIGNYVKGYNTKLLTDKGVFSVEAHWNFYTGLQDRRIELTYYQVHACAGYATIQSIKLFHQRKRLAGPL